MKSILFCLILLFSLSLVEVKACEKDKVIQVSRQIFGEPLDTTRNLYEVNRFYVYRVDFDKQNCVVELAVEPKYYFETSHPDWEETDDFKPLTLAEYKILLEKLEGIKSKGNLTIKSRVGVVGNATAFFKDQYQQATLETGYIFMLDADENTPTKIRFFRVNFREDSDKKIPIKPLTKRNE